MKFSIATLFIGVLVTQVIAGPTIHNLEKRISCNRNKGVCNAQGTCDDIGGGGTTEDARCQVGGAAAGSGAAAKTIAAKFPAATAARAGALSGTTQAAKGGAGTGTGATTGSKAGLPCNRNKGQCNAQGTCDDIGGGGTTEDAACV